jgi:hypothetical protein
VLPPVYTFAHLLANVNDAKRKDFIPPNPVHLCRAPGAIDKCTTEMMIYSLPVCSPVAISLSAAICP